MTTPEPVRSTRIRELPQSAPGRSRLTLAPVVYNAQGRRGGGADRRGGRGRDRAGVGGRADLVPVDRLRSRPAIVRTAASSRSAGPRASLASNRRRSLIALSHAAAATSSLSASRTPYWAIPTVFIS